jgi:hypothetical protein
MSRAGGRGSSCYRERSMDAPAHGERDEGGAEQPAAPGPPGNARNNARAWGGIAQREREDRHAEIAHEARPRGRVQRVAQVRVQRLLDDKADASRDGEEHGEGDFNIAQSLKGRICPFSDGSREHVKNFVGWQLTYL